MDAVLAYLLNDASCCKGWLQAPVVTFSCLSISSRRLEHSRGGTKQVKAVWPSTCIEGKMIYAHHVPAAMICTLLSLGQFVLMLGRVGGW